MNECKILLKEIILLIRNAPVDKLRLIYRFSKSIIA